jgi:hypothetical protein
MTRLSKSQRKHGLRGYAYNLMLLLSEVRLAILLLGLALLSVGWLIRRLYYLAPAHWHIRSGKKWQLQ